MTSLSDRPNTALLVVDVQNDVVANACRRDDVIANIETLVAHARTEQVPVIWVQHSDDELVEGSDGWQYVPELRRQASEALVHKRYGDAFEDTTLESELTKRHVGRLVVVGAQTDACIRGNAPRGVRTRLRHGLGRGRAHHRGLFRPRAPAGRQGHRPHQYVLDLAIGPRSFGHRGRDRRHRLPRDGRGSVVVLGAPSVSAVASTT